MQDHGGDVDKDINPTPAKSPKQEVQTPPISPPAMLNPLPSTPGPTPGQSSSNSPHPQTPLLALRRPVRTRRDLSEWVPQQWTIHHPTPAIESDSEDSDDPVEYGKHIG